MRVLQVTSSYPKFPGDTTAPFVESIVLGLLARGHGVDVVLPEHKDLRRPDGDGARFFPYRYAPREDLTLWGYAQSLESDVKVRREAYLLAPIVLLSLRNTVGHLLREERYDVVHVHWLIPNAAMVADIVDVFGVPLVVSSHGSDVFMAERSPLLARLARRALDAAGAVTGCSRDLERRLVALGAPWDRVRTVPYGVDASTFAPRAAPGLEPGRILNVLAFGRMVEKKGFAYLIDAVAGRPEMRLVLAGKGDLRSSLEERARRVGAAVSFPGALARDAMAEAIAAADIVVVPSVVDSAGNVDGLPNALLEALAAGRPVVASRVAGIPDVVEDGANGLLVPERDTEALQRALLLLAGDEALRERLGGEARRRAQEQLTWERAVRSFEECYAQAATLGSR